MFGAMVDDVHAGPVLEGLAGWVRGERFLLSDGEVIIGRSRACDISLRRVAGYLRQPSEERDKDHDFNTVSRKHLIVRVDGNSVSFSDNSTNGSFVDEDPITDGQTVDLSETSVVLRLGTREAFRLRLGTDDQAAVADEDLVGSDSEATSETTGPAPDAPDSEIVEAATESAGKDQAELAATGDGDDEPLADTEASKS